MKMQGVEELKAGMNGAARNLLSDFIRHNYPPPLRDQMLKAATDLLQCSVLEPPVQPL
jgi:hypothetical protein